MSEPVSVLHLTKTRWGGAGRTANRLHAILPQAEIRSRLVSTDDDRLDADAVGNDLRERMATVLGTLRTSFGVAARALAGAGLRTDPRYGLISLALLPSAWPRRLNAADASIVHLHWINDELLSIADIGRIRKPIVWTLHDQWPIAGARHYPSPGESGWSIARQSSEFGEASVLPPTLRRVDAWVTERKRTHWPRNVSWVAPSEWMKGRVQESPFADNGPVTVIPNPIDSDMWFPVPKREAQEALGLPDGVRRILFGAMQANQDPRKGLDLLIEAIGWLAQQSRSPPLELVRFGTDREGMTLCNGLPTRDIGTVRNDARLRFLYSACDLLVVPSRIDNFPSVALEAQSCELPVVAFRVGGLADMVEHRVNGYLAEPEDPRDLALGIDWCLGLDAHTRQRMGHHGRQRVIERCSPDVVAKRYADVYARALDSVNG